MPTTIFISDLHLCESRPDITNTFLNFIDKIRHQQLDALYILGDFFEVWVGDDNQTELTTQVAETLQNLAKTGIPIYFIHGNRDFLLGQRFAKTAGLTLLPEQAVIDLYGTKTLLLHGDEMCTQDLEYQAFRKKSRGWWWPKLMLAMPLFYRKRVAQQYRNKSKLAQQGKPLDILDVSDTAVEQMFARYNTKLMIHGHTHRPGTHWHGQNKRVVLGDWYTQCSYLEVTPFESKLHFSALE